MIWIESNEKVKQIIDDLKTPYNDYEYLTNEEISLRRCENNRWFKNSQNFFRKYTKPLFFKGYRKKLVISGSVYDFTDYNQEVFYHGGKNKPVGRKGNFLKETTDNEKDKNRETSLRRARQSILQIINSNVYQYFKEGTIEGEPIPYNPIFMTFTFRRDLGFDVTNLKECNKRFDLFRRKLERYVGYKVKYVTVVEFQDNSDGAVHYHTVYFNLPYIPVSDDFYKKYNIVPTKSDRTLTDLWEYGSITPRKLKDVDNVGAYLAGYLTKAYMSNSKFGDRLKGKKCYFVSRGLFKPFVLKGDSEENIKKIDSIISAIQGFQTYAGTYGNEYFNKIDTKQFNLKASAKKLQKFKQFNNQKFKLHSVV